MTPVKIKVELLVRIDLSSHCQYKICSSLLFPRIIPPHSLPQESHSFNITSLPDSHFLSLLSIAIHSCYYWVTNRETCDCSISLCSSLGFYKPRSSGNLYLQNVCMHHDSQHLKPVCSTDIMDTDTERYTCTVMHQMHAQVSIVSSKAELANLSCLFYFI